MRNLTVFISFTFIFLTLPLITIGQDKLRLGVNPLGTSVQLPYAYFDILRNTSTGWYSEKLETSSNTWETTGKTRQLKDAKGRFINIDTEQWSDFEKKWVPFRKTHYEYISDNSNELVQIDINTITNLRDLGTRQKLKYKDSKLVEVNNFSRDNEAGTPFNNGSNSYFFYNNIGQRVKDSFAFVFPQNISLLFRDFDNNGRVVKETFVNPFVIIDTIRYTVYQYHSNNKIKQVQSFALDPARILVETLREVYAYNSNGEIDSLIVYNRPNTSSVIQLSSLYKHYYNSEQKISTMVKKSFFNNYWRNNDSIVINYLPNGYYDTAFIYQVNVSTNLWRSNYSSRLIFNAINLSSPKITNIRASFIAFPNPTSHKLLIRFESHFNSPQKVTLTDMTGKKLVVKEIVSTDTEINMQDLPKGIYFLNVGGYTKKIIKE